MAILSTGTNFLYSSPSCLMVAVTVFCASAQLQTERDENHWKAKLKDSSVVLLSSVFDKNEFTVFKQRKN